MNRFVFVLLTLIIMLVSEPSQATQLTQPSCSAIEQWANSYQPGKKVEPLPGWEVNSLFADEKTIPLFGYTVVTWQNDDTTALQGWLAGCRKEAGARRDIAMVKQLGVVIKETKTTYKQLRKVWSANKMVDNTVNNILKQRKESDDYIALLEMTAAAINGDDISTKVEALPPAWYGNGRSAQQLTPFAQLLTQEQRQAFIDKLQIKQETVVDNVAEKEAKQQALLAQIAAVPNTNAGYAQLMGIYNQVDSSQMSAEEYDAFNRAFQTKRRLIQTTAEAQAAAEKSKRMNTPAPVVKRLGDLLRGDSVDEVQIDDLVLDSPLSRIETQILGAWQLKQTATMALDRREYTTTRKQLEASLQAASHDGGYVKLRTYHGQVGEIIYEEHYSGPMPVQELKSYLLKRFDDPDQVVLDRPDALEMVWQGSKRFMQISANNRISMARQLYDVRSHISIRVWSEDFDDYIKAGDARCQEIANKPQQSLSIKEKQDYMMDCRTP
jgi:hypothetical protein